MEVLQTGLHWQMTRFAGMLMWRTGFQTVPPGDDTDSDEYMSDLNDGYDSYDGYDDYEDD